MCLRLSRDLQGRRSLLISDLVGIVCDVVSFDTMVGRILITPGVKPEHCDQLLALLKKHEDALQNPLTTAMQGEYLMFRFTLHQLQVPEERKLLKQSLRGFGTTDESKDDSIGAVLAQLQLLFSGDGQQPSAANIAGMNLIAASIDWNKEVVAADEFYNSSTEIGTKPYREGMAAWSQYETTGKFKQMVVRVDWRARSGLSFSRILAISLTGMRHRR